MKVRVICNDPDATDSSSSDEEEDEEIGYKPRYKKQFVREIIMPNPSIHNPIASRNHGHDNSASRQTQLGKLEAFISDPVKKMKFSSVASDDAHEEATIVYDPNKFKFDSIDQFQNPGTQSMALKLNSNVNESEITVNEELHDLSVTASENHVQFTKQDCESFAVVGPEKSSDSASNSTMQESIRDKFSSLQEDGVSLATMKEKAANAYKTWILEFQRLVGRSTKNRIGKDQSSIPETSTPLGSDSKYPAKENSAALQKNDFQIVNLDIKARRQLVLRQDGVVRKRSREEFVDPRDSDCSEELEEIKSGIGSAELRGHTNKGTKPIENDESKPPRLGAQESVDAATTTATRYTVRQTREGKWLAGIGKPKKRTELYLGTFNSQELGFQSNVSSTTKKAKLEPGIWFSDKGAPIKQNNSKPPRGGEEESVEAVVTTTDVNCKNFRQRKHPPGIRQKRPGGLWSAEIRIPRTSSKIYLGAYKTMEEAANAFNKKKQEFQSTAASSSPEKQKLQTTAASMEEAANAFNKKKQEFQSAAASSSPKKQKLQTTAASNTKKPDQSVRSWLGQCRSYSASHADSAPPAVEKSTVRKRELQSTSISSNTRKPDQPVRSWLDQCRSYSASHAAAAAPAVKKSTVRKLELQSTAASNITMKPEPQHIGCSVDQYGSSSISLPSSTSPEVEKSIVTFGSSHSSDGSSNCSMVDDLSFMKMEQEDRFGCGIINCYGQLLGEYSKLDDELWLCKPGEEDEAEAAASTNESTMSDWYSWEFEPPVKLEIA